MSFQDFNLAPELLRAIDDLGHTKATPVQQQAIPVILKGFDVMALAQTGTGKTAAFTLPLLQLLHTKQDTEKSFRPVRALILTPTRELAAQVGESVRQYSRHLDIRLEVLVGGVNITPQISKLRKGADVIIATPGRLIDLVNQNALALSQVQMLVLDEADRMLDMGFIHDVKRIMALLPKNRQNMLFSATLSSEIQGLANSILRNHKLIEVAHRNVTTELVSQVVYPVDQKRKRELLSYLIGFNNWKQVLVFTRTKHGANKLCEQLIEDGLTAAAIHGNKSQGARTRALDDFKSGKVRVLVATDIAARGIDIEHLPFVVNFELPNVPEDYVHRIGRTGRAGKSGSAISLVCSSEMTLLRDIEKLTKKTIAKQIQAGYEPDPNSQNAPVSRSRNNSGTNRNARVNVSFAPSEKPRGRRPAPKDTIRQAESSKRDNWQGESRRNDRSSEGNARGEWRPGSRPAAARSSEGNARGEWRPGSRPAAARSSEGNARGEWRPGSRPAAARSSEGNVRGGESRSGSRPAARTSEGARKDWRAGGSKPAARTSEGNARGNWRDAAPKPAGRRNDSRVRSEKSTDRQSSW